MKFTFLPIAFALALCSCKEKSAPISTGNREASPVASAPPTPPASKSSAAPTATAEQIGSVLRVQASVPGFPPQETVGALLHRDEISNKALLQGKSRFFAAQFRGLEEEQLRNHAAHFKVYRKKADSRGEATVQAFFGRFVQCDPATKVAIFEYLEDFDYADDVGFHLKRGDFAHSDLPLLRISAPPEAPGKMPVFFIDTGLYSGSKSPATVNLPQVRAEASADSTLLAVEAPDKLAGFVEEIPGSLPVTTLSQDFPLKISTPEWKIKSVGFGNGYDGIQCRLVFETDSKRQIPLVALRIREKPEISLEEASRPNPEGTYRPIDTRYTANLSFSEKGGFWEHGLKAPEEAIDTTYLLQVSWPLFDWSAGGHLQGYTAPFLVRLHRTRDGVYPTVEGLPDTGVAGSAPGSLNKSQTNAEAEAESRFPLETPVKNVHLMAGGKEALIELQGAPYWKRFSFEKNDWLPLPPGISSNFSVTGNLTALFVLNRGASEVSKYLLPGLQPAGSVKLLQPKDDYFSILAGCNSEHAPVHVLSAGNSLALAPETLQRRDVPYVPDGISVSLRKFARDAAYAITGDGLSFRARGGREKRHFYYDSDARGLNYLDLDLGSPDFSQVPGVAAVFSVKEASKPISSLIESRITPDGKERPDPDRPGPECLAENAPVIFRLLPPDRNAVPPLPVRLLCYSYFDDAPFAEINAPELGEARDWTAWAMDRRVFFDPYSLRLGTLAADGKTWLVRKIVAPEKRNHPVLLNWPDTSPLRGARFEFTPRILGEGKYSAQVLVQPDANLVTGGQGKVELAIAPEEFESVKLLTLKTLGKDGSGIEYPIPLRISGTPMPFAAGPDADRHAMNYRGAGFKSLDSPMKGDLVMHSDIVVLPNQVAKLLGAAAGCAVLITKENHIDFLSLQTRKIVGSFAGPAGAFYYPGAGALIEIDPERRTLTRISVPGGQRERAVVYSAEITVGAVAIGADPASSITLGIGLRYDTKTARISDLLFSPSTGRLPLVVLDGKSLLGAGRAQPISLARMLNQTNVGNSVEGFGLGGLGVRPMALPVSHNGGIIRLSQSMLVLSPGCAVSYPLGNRSSFNLSDNAGQTPAGGSISGLMAFSWEGKVYKGDTEVGGGFPQNFLGATPCGRYHLRRLSAGPNEDECMEVLLAETGARLMLAARFAFFSEDGISTHISRRCVMLGDEGPLAILNSQGTGCEIVDFNIPALLKKLAPEDFHVTSQPTPIVMEGGTMQYQVLVNNPDAVQTMRLQSPVPGAILSPQGLFQYLAPARITAATQTNIAIEVVGKNDKVALHDFPIYVLPRPRAGAPLPPARL